VEVLAGLGIFAILLFIFLYLLPIFLILTSDKVTGGEKIFWIIAILFVSWFAWIFYALLAPISSRPRERY